MAAIDKEEFAWVFKGGTISFDGVTDLSVPLKTFCRNFFML